MQYDDHFFIGRGCPYLGICNKVKDYDKKYTGNISFPVGIGGALLLYRYEDNVAVYLKK
tara:strand:- start:1301 stop:1477 length:177 start_codon:yes stop_codon:yes gene_type:complete